MVFYFFICLGPGIRISLLGFLHREKEGVYVGEHFFLGSVVAVTAYDKKMDTYEEQSLFSFSGFADLSHKGS
ncbi:MAG: hypothetical protein WBL02_03460 [Methanomethylovorans sp.]|uniref:hypothetical protein n=1 Tax=Methanomethylovorans sp. TaxID=2758717 RepID=UPI000AD502E1|nr:hypothetical protein [Methanomethylovorans sp.]